MVINLQKLGSHRLRGARLRASQTWRVHARGRDITDIVWYLDSRRRVARVYVRGEDGRFMRDPSRTFMTTVVRDVRIIKQRSGWKKV
jgi:hypothetical protein